MKKKYFTNLLLFFLATIFLTCSDHAGVILPQKNIVGLQKEIKKILPIYPNGEITQDYFETLWYTKHFKLIPITGGVDSIAIRIWYNYPTNEIQIAEIFKSNNEWASNFYYFHYKYYNDDSLTILSKNAYNARPKSGWNQCIGLLLSKGLLVLPGYTELPSYHINKIGNSELLVEIATSEDYRLYSYPVPSQNESNFQEVKNIEEIMQIIEREFSFKQIEPI